MSDKNNTSSEIIPDGYRPKPTPRWEKGKLPKGQPKPPKENETIHHDSLGRGDSVGGGRSDG
jgi:hypothetical protein